MNVSNKSILDMCRLLNDKVPKAPVDDYKLIMPTSVDEPQTASLWVKKNGKGMWFEITFVIQQVERFEPINVRIRKR